MLCRFKCGPQRACPSGQFPASGLFLVLSVTHIWWVNIEWMSWWMSQNSRWCEWTSKYNAVYSSYDAHDNPVPVHVYLCLFTSDWLRGIHNADNPSGLCRDCVLGTFSTLKSGMSPIILAAGAHVPTNLRFINGNTRQDCFLQKEARVCVSDAIVIEDSKFKWCFCCGRWASDRGSRCANVNSGWVERHLS